MKHSSEWQWRWNVKGGLLRQANDAGLAMTIEVGGKREIASLVNNSGFISLQMTLASQG